MKDSADEFLKKGLQSAQDEKWSEAVLFLEDAIRTNPKLSDAYEVLGIVYSKLSRLDDAIQVMKNLIQVDPDHIMAHANLSRFYQQKDMLFEAEAEQAEARRLSWKQELKNSGAPETALMEDEDAKMAKAFEKIERYKKVVQMDPKDILGYFSLGSALHEAKRFQEAVDILAQGLLVNPKHSPSYLTLGLSYEALGDAFRAKMTYQSGIPIANERGDIIPLRKMESRLRSLSKKTAGDRN